jgi:hypothetical protein
MFGYSKIKVKVTLQRRRGASPLDDVVNFEMRRLQTVQAAV